MNTLSIVSGLVGSILVAGSLAWYQIVMQISIEQSGSSRALIVPAYLTLVLVITGLLVAFVTLTLQLARPSAKDAQGGFTRIITNLSLVIRDNNSLRVFAFSSSAYGLLFAIVSSVIVFRLGADFSSVYGVRVPSVVPVVCCGSLGQMPQFVFYLTQQLAILLIPTNVILLFVVSWLVGLNSAIATYAFQHRPSTASMRWIGGLGAFIAFFTACPTCAGFFLLSSAGPTGAVALAVSLSPYQGIFAVIGLPALLLAPVITLRRLGSLEVCSPREKGTASVG